MSLKLESGQRGFSSLRMTLWPIHSSELMKLIPMLLIAFLINFNYNILRVMKDTLVVTAEGSGAEVIPFIKVWVMLPGALLMTFLYTRLSNIFSREAVIYCILGGFLVYFCLFTIYLYPHREHFHLHAFANFLKQVLPEGCCGLIMMIQNWTLTIFYALSELWSSTVLAVLFWGFANQITRLDEAKRFYGLFGIGANFSGVVAGYLSASIVSRPYNSLLPFGANSWDQTMFVLMGLVMIAGIATLFLIRWMYRTILCDSRYYDPSEAKREEKVKGTLSLKETFVYLYQSRYLLSIGVIVLIYNIVINLVEVIWKHQVKELYPNPEDYHLYMSHVTTIIGIISTLTALLVSGNSIRKFGWTFTALITPMILLLTSIGFFGFYFMKESAMHHHVLVLLGASPLVIVVFFGTLQNILSRAAKYTVFDATKEIAFIPLSPDCKLKGKAAIDGFFSRVGKSGGAVIHQGLLLFFVTITACIPYVASILFGAILIWIAAVRYLGIQFSALTSSSNELQESRRDVLEGV